MFPHPSWPPCRPPHPHTTLYEVQVRRLVTRCRRPGCGISLLTAVEMRDAWLRMRGIRIEIEVKGVRGQELEIRGGGPVVVVAATGSVKKEKKSVRWGGIEVFGYEEGVGDDEAGDERRGSEE